METSRLTLRRFTEDDVDNLFDLNSDPEVMELGYRLRRAAWNKGYATEGSRALIDKGFADLGAPRVFALTMTVNTASRHVLEKSGLVLVRTFGYEGADPIEGHEHGEVEYALTRSGWQARHQGVRWFP